jgi:hypothetical protein
MREAHLARILEYDNRGNRLNSTHGIYSGSPLLLLCYSFRDEAIQLSVGNCPQSWTILFLNHSHGER